MEEATNGSITDLIGGLKIGSGESGEKLFQRYHARIVSLARSKLGSTALLGADEEDVALSVLNALLDGAPRNKFPDLANREELWKLLRTITIRKVWDLKKQAKTVRRGRGLVRTESDLRTGEDDDEGLSNIEGREHPADLALEVADEIQCRLKALSDHQFRLILLLKLEGYTHEDIAVRLGCTRRTVIRRVNSIRDAWNSEAG